ncbi:MAG: hypothetical protein V1789_04310 [PVC group bacterium]
MKPAVNTIARVLRGRFYQVLFLAAFAYMVYLALSYSLCWQDFDNAHKFFPRAIANGPELRWEDFTRVFQDGWDGYKIGPITRLRYFTDLVSLVDTKVRIWLFNYIPPHPSISLVWLFVLFLSPLMMFKLGHQLTGDRSAAWIATILFTLSTGNLFGINKMALPAKPLANFFCLVVFYLGAIVDHQVRTDSYFSPRARRRFLLMLAVMLLAFFTDETTWFFYFMVPVLFPEIFCPWRKRKFPLIGYLALLIMAFFFTFVICPYLLNLLTPGGVSVDYFHDYTQDPEAGPLLPTFFGPRYLLLTARNLLWTQLVPWGWFWRGIIFLAILLVYFAFQFKNLAPSLRRLVLRFVAVFIIYVIFMSHAIARVYWEEGYILKYSLYYGALLAIFLPVPLAVLLSRNSGFFRGVLNKLLLLFLMMVMAYNFLRINEDIRFLQTLYENVGEMDYVTSRTIWRDRKDPEAIRRHKSRYPIWSAWAYIQELEVIADQHAGKKTAVSASWPE